MSTRNELRPTSSSAREAVARFLATRGFAGATVTLLRGDYDFRDLARWRRLVDDVGPPLLTMTDIDEATNRVAVGVRDEGARSRVLTAIDSAGAPRAAFAVSVMSPPSRSNLQGFARPVRGGLQVKAQATPPGAGECTLTWVAIREIPGVGYDVNGPRYVSTNAHCAPPMGVTAGNVIGQPTQASRIGVEFSDPPFVSSSTDPACPSTQAVCRRSDIALFLLDSNSPTVSTFNGVATASGTSLTGTAFYTGKQQSFAPNQPVRKIGRSTGQTQGVITNTCVNVYIANDIMVCQMYATYSQADGDSGAPVWHYSGNDRWIVGVHWGFIQSENRSIFSMWMDAQAELANDIIARTGQFWLPAFTMGPANP